MGAGASKTDAPVKRELRTGTEHKDEAEQIAKRPTKDDVKFIELCQQIFALADKDQDAKLDYNEFWEAFSSKTLNLNLSDEEMSELRDMSDTNGDGKIDFEEFKALVANLKDYIKLVYEKVASGANDWCCLKDADTGQMMFLNKRTGKTQKSKPKHFKDERVDELKFDHITLDDGTVISTYKDEEGKNMYMDWEAGTWVPLPEEWSRMLDATEDIIPDVQNAVVNATDDDQTEEVDPRLGTFKHPTKGTYSTYIFSNERNTRLFFDDDEGAWVRMPLSWERNVEDVQAMLQEVHAALPDWGDVNEQLLVLRDCNYDVQDAIAFGEINYGFGTKKMDAAERRKSIGGAANRMVRRQSVYQGGSSAAVVDIEEMEGDFGNLSAPVAAKINHLELDNVALREKIEKLESETMKNMEEQVFTLKREKTMAQKETTRRKSISQNDGDRMASLSEKVKEQREEIAELERDLIKAKAEVETAKSAGAEAVGGATAEHAELESVRKDLLEANLTISDLKTQADKIDVGALKHINAEMKELVLLRRELEFTGADFVELEISFKQLKGLVGKMAEQGAGASAELVKKYRAEVILRKQLYNQVQELRGNIRVFCRCRKDKRVKCALKFPSKTEIILDSMAGKPTTVDFDKTYGPDTEQAAIFEDTKEVIMSVLDGYNVCLMAYGQTGAGKSFTMMGPPDNPGVNRRAIKQLLELVQGNTDTMEVKIICSLMEVYNENVFDLLAVEGRVKRDVKVGAQGAFVHEITERQISNADETELLMADGDKNRSVAATSMNAESSRSHLIFQIRVDTVNKVSGMRSSAKLTLVDLAGSERIAKSEVTGDQLVEAAAINKSLSALGQCFQAIAKQAPHVPFRNSKLTHVLQDSLGGDSKTCMFINVRPDDDNLSETWSTLNFGQNIRKIELGPAKAHKTGKKPPPPKRK